MFALVRRWTAWQPEGLGPYETIRARLMGRAVVAFVAVTALTIPIQLLVGPAALALLPAAFVALYLLTFAVLRAGRQQLAAALIVAASLAVLAAVLIPLGGIAGTSATYVGVTVIVSTLWLEPRWAAAAVLASLALLVGVALADARLDLPALIPPDRMRVALAISQALAIGFAAVLVGTTSDALHATSAEAEARAEQAARATAAARAASEAKARFLATMSHELRTPLNAILGYAGLLRDDAGPDAADLERIEVAGRHLLALVDDVLEMARADSSPPRPRLEEVELRELVIAQVGRWPGAEIRVTGEVVVARTDRAQLGRIVRTLVARAVAVGPRVEVTVGYGPEGATIAVRDHGRAPDREHLARVFEPFASEREADPTGLGLALAQRLARALGAEVEAGLAPGGGLCLVVHLPELV